MRKWQIMTLLEVMGVEYNEKETNKVLMEKLKKAEKVEAKEYRNTLKELI